MIIKQLKIAIAVYISNVSYNKKHSEAIMDVSCPHCNKTFANKYSLASHMSRYHNKSQQEAETSTTTEQYNNVSADADIESDEKVSDDEQQNSSENNESDEDQRSEEESHSSNTKDTLATSSDSEANYSTDGSENKAKTTLLSDGKKDALVSTDSENTSSSEDSDSKHKITTKRKLKKQLKMPSKKRKVLDSIKDEATELLASIESMMFEDKCKKNANQYFDLLDSYEIKHKIFSNLIGPVESKAIFMNEAIVVAELGAGTLNLIKAVLETRSLREVNILLNENIGLVKKIAIVLRE